MLQKKIMQMIYQKAKRPEDLPWHSETPARLLVQAASQRKKPGRALDVGCGAGVFSVYLAKQGYEVTGLDFIPKALEMAQSTAKAENVHINWVQADLLTWRTSQPFELILDSGALHSISSTHLQRYKEQLLSWLAPGGDFILAHWGKRHVFDWRPIGPRRRSRRELVGLFSPELSEKAYGQEVMTGIPLPFGPSVLGQSFWFERRA